MEARAEIKQPSEPYLELQTTGEPNRWLYENHCSLVFTTYQAGKVFFIGLKEDGSLNAHERTIERCMGLAVQGNSLYMSSVYQVWRFENVLLENQFHQGCDRLYLPQAAYITGDIDGHDLHIDKNDQLILVNTLFSCLVKISEAYSFTPIWKPPFISELAPEDRCHLNGLAMVDQMPRYVSMVAKTNTREGWREERNHGGVIMDITDNSIIAENLSMPHSPRWHQGKLWLIQSGTGELGFINPKNGTFKATTFLPGYARGLSFKGDYAIVGLSKCRENHTFTDLALDDKLTKIKQEASCGIAIINLKSGEIEHSIKLEGVVRELYDVAIIEGALRPMAIGFKNDDIKHTLRVSEPEPLNQNTF